MTPFRHIFRLFAVLVAFMVLGILGDYCCTAHAGNTRRTMRLTVYRPLRIQGRNASGRPFLMAIYHGAKTADNVTANLRIGRIIGDIIFTPFRH
jgi:hypothetical protein